MTSLPVEHWGDQLSSSSPSEQKVALGHLAYYGPAAVPYLPAIVRHLTGSNDSLGLTAAWSLAHIGAPAYPALTLALSSRDATVRHRAAYGLGEAGPDAADLALKKLDSLAQGDPVKRVRDMAIWARDQVNPRQRSGDRNLWMSEGLDSKDPLVRVEAVQRLGSVPVWNQAAISELIRILADTSEIVQSSAIDALVQKGQAALPMLNAALANPRERVRSGALAAIARIRSQF